MRFIKHTGKAINTYSMIRENDTVLLSASGGKDSLALALALSIRRKWLPINYELKALMINWIEHPIPEEYRGLLTTFFSPTLVMISRLLMNINSQNLSKVNSTAISAPETGGESFSLDVRKRE